MHPSRVTSCHFPAVPQEIQNTRALLYGLCKLPIAAPTTSVFQRSIESDYIALDGLPSR